MFSKFFKKKHLSDTPITKSNNESRNALDIKNDNTEMTTKSKPVIYFSTDKGKYVCASVPDNVNVITNMTNLDEYNSDVEYNGNSTKSTVKKDDCKYMDNIYDSYMNGIYDTDDNNSDNTENNNSDNTGNPSRNLDYILQNFLFDVENGIYKKINI